MSDKMTPIPFEKLLNHILTEYADKKSIFGIRKFYKAKKSKNLSLFGKTIEMPFGPAAGPHTQLAQNIAAAYLCGSRFFELKTVQKLDGEDLPVSKPCITAADEAYNCEWSTELYVEQAFDEYVKAWFLLKILAIEFNLGSSSGFVFNMSVGYDLDGIKLKKIDRFIEGLKNAEHTTIFAECKKISIEMLKAGRFKHLTEKKLLAIESDICSSITLSTLHGCPPDEIERIAHYLLTEKNLHTFIKCNPTILGYDFARQTLDNLGFDYIAFDDHHFKADLQFEDAVPMLQRLQKTADSLNLSFGVKLTNTFPVDVKADELPSAEMYMSGRSLAPLSLAAAKKLSEPFKGKLRISYSGGADWSNITDIFDAGIWPITLATSILKPGGYERLVQIAKNFENQTFLSFTGVNMSSLKKLSDAAAAGYLFSQKKQGEPAYKKSVKLLKSRKLNKKVPLFNCFTASCSESCPIHQDIPAYLRLNGEGKFIESLEVITDKNPLPFMTGTICAHPCMAKCTRSFYDTNIYIRSEKLRAAEAAYSSVIEKIKAETAQKAVKTKKSAMRLAVIGAGPAGLSAAYFAARAGISVSVFEKRESCGGIVRHIIPGFRIAKAAIERDVELVKAAGAKIITGTEISDISSLFAQGYTHVLAAIGAWQNARLDLKNGKALDALEFLADYKAVEGTSGKPTKNKAEQLIKKYGKNIVVIGGGNTAMDTARAAKRIPGIESVQLVYRRTKRYMPADEEELILAIEDGVEFKELLAPVSFQAPNGTSSGELLCEVMELGAPDESGRRSPKKTGKTCILKADSLIAATGANMEADFYRTNKIQLDKRDRPVLSSFMQTSVPNLYIAGDATRGPATVVEAIADAAAFIRGLSAENKKYVNIAGGKYTALNYNTDKKIPWAKKGLIAPKSAEAKRCLECSTICELCCDVCPNRANISLNVKDETQIIHIDAMCNECGNCTVFCPYDSAPYKEKFTLFSAPKDLADSSNNGFAPLEAFSGNKPKKGTLFQIRLNGKVFESSLEKPAQELSENPYAKDIIALIKEVWYNNSYLYY